MATAGVPLWSTTAASNATADPAVNWAEGQSPSSVNDSARAMMSSVAKWRNDLYGLTTGGTSTAYTVTTNSTYASATDMSGAIFTIVPDNTSGAAPTLAVDGLTARALNVSTGVAIPTGALVAGTPYLVKYVHATTEFIVLGVLGKGLLTALDIINGSSLTAIATDDTLPIYDLSTTTNKRILVSDLLKVVNGLVEDSTPDSAADYLMTYDASATSAKKVLIDNFPKGAQPPPGAFKGLVIKVTSNTGLTAVADFVTTTDGTLFKTTALSSTINMATTGANALDTSSVSSATWYAIWAIAKADGTTAGLASTSFTSPTMPSGYTYKARIGAVRTAAGSAQLMGTWQFGRRAQYIVGLAQTTDLPALSPGFTPGSWTVASVSSVVPTTASIIHLVFAKTGGSGAGYIAPNTSYGVAGAGAPYPPITTLGANTVSGQGYLVLESTNIYSTVSSGGGSMTPYGFGWEDNI